MRHALASGAGDMAVTLHRWYLAHSNRSTNVAFLFHQSPITYSTVSKGKNYYSICVLFSPHFHCIHHSLQFTIDDLRPNIHLSQYKMELHLLETLIAK